MPEPESVRQAFERTEPPLGDVARYVRDTLDQYCRDRKYLFSERTKTSESLAEKLESGRFHRWSKLDDLYACTVVVPVQDHEDRVIRHLDAVFDRKTIRNRDATSKAPDVFRFDGTRWYGTIPSTAAAERQPGADEIIFEVQVVTAFEYAWMAVTHDLVYKADEVDWRQLRLAAQLKAAVEQVEVLIAAFDSASSVVRESPWSETTSKSAIVTRFKTLADDGHIPATLEPSSWRRFADNVFSLVSSYTPDRRKVEEAVQSLLDKVETELRTPTGFSLPNSGTLFQFVVHVVAANGSGGNLESFVVVPSGELRDFYQVGDLPKPFRFDGLAGEPRDTPAADEVQPGATTETEAGPVPGREVG